MEFAYTVVAGIWDTVFYLSMFAVMIGVLVGVHEYGHFLAARSLGVRVLRFSIGFGPVLYSWRDSQGTEYGLSLLPLGGYVMMQDDRSEMTSAAEGEENTGSYDRSSIWTKLTICFAGPAANLALAVVLQMGLLMYGMEAARAQMGTIQPQSVAEAAGLQRGDVVRSVDGREVFGLGDLQLALVNAIGKSVPLQVVREGRDTLALDLDLSALNSDDLKNPMEAVGAGVALFESLLVGGVVSGSAAERAGFQGGDRILSADGQDLDSWGQWVQVVSSAPGQELAVWVQRSEEQLELSLIPAAVSDEGQTRGRAGIYQGRDSELIFTRRLSLWQAPTAAVQRVYDLSTLTASSIVSLMTGRMGLEHLSGPVGIARISGDAARIGLAAFITIMSLLSISLGIINLVPLPILDGGRALLHTIESLLRRPLPVQVENALNLVGMALVISLMTFTVYQDIGRF